jgi:hypothetical protein
VAEVKNPQPVELFVGVIFGDHGLLEPLKAELSNRFGDIELGSPVFDFGVTSYYRDEMGPDLKRVFFAFEDLIDPGRIVEVKLATNALEKQFAREGKRRVNLDPGYMDFYKVVLASNKFLGQKIYLGKGVYADPTLYYDKGWKPYEWGFPDFKSGRYNAFLTDIRKAYKSKTRKRGHNGIYV